MMGDVQLITSAVLYSFYTFPGWFMEIHVLWRRQHDDLIITDIPPLLIETCLEKSEQFLCESYKFSTTTEHTHLRIWNQLHNTLLEMLGEDP